MKPDRDAIVTYLLDNYADEEWLGDEEDAPRFKAQVDDLMRELDAAVADRVGEWVAAREAGRPLGPLGPECACARHEHQADCPCYEAGLEAQREPVGRGAA